MSMRTYQKYGGASLRNWHIHWLLEIWLDDLDYFKTHHYEEELAKAKTWLEF